MSFRRVVRLILAGVATASVLAMVNAAPGATAATDPIQPGDEIFSPVGGCTLNFIYDGTGAQAGKVFGGTAAHCVSKIGEPVELGSGEAFGRVALIGDEDSTVGDYAFIEILPEFVARVSPAMKGSPSYPTGVTTASETAVGDTTQFSGYGVGFGLTSLTQERRIGVLTGDNAERHQVLGTLIFGDSGGPIVHIPTGKALGIVSRLCFGVCEEEGPTVEGLLAKAAARGFTVTLRTV